MTVQAKIGLLVLVKVMPHKVDPRSSRRFHRIETRIRQIKERLRNASKTLKRLEAGTQTTLTAESVHFLKMLHKMRPTPRSKPAPARTVLLLLLRRRIPNTHNMETLKEVNPRDRKYMAKWLLPLSLVFRIPIASLR